MSTGRVLVIESYMSSTRTVLNNSTRLQVRKSNKFTAVFVSHARNRRSRSSFPLFSQHVEPHGHVAEVDRGGAGLSTRPQARTHSPGIHTPLAHPRDTHTKHASIHTRTLHTRVL